MCITKIPVDSLQWLDASGGVMREERGSIMELMLDLNVTARHNNATFTCQLSTHSGFVAIKSIRIITGRKTLLSSVLICLHIGSSALF